MRNESECLLTSKSLALSLAPPRSHPIGSSHDLLLRGHHQSAGFSAHHHLQTPSPSSTVTTADVRKLGILNETHQKRRRKQHHEQNHHRVHPHLPPPSDHRLTRLLFGGRLLSRRFQNTIRDDGTLRSLFDGAVTIGVPGLAVQHPRLVKEFLALSKSGTEVDYGGVSGSGVNTGGRHRQKLDLFLPDGLNADDTNVSSSLRGFVFFVHGGAWGSGQKWMYRLAALPFLQSKMAVAIVGYRTYPDADLEEQVDDLQLAADFLMMRYPHLLRPPPNAKAKEGDGGRDWRGVTLAGHSSGGNIAMLLLLRLVQRQVQQQQQPQPSSNHTTNTNTNTNTNAPILQFKSFIGLAGVYSIDHHFDYEANRGVEELSPMKACCGYTREAFRQSDPTVRLRQWLLSSTLSPSSSSTTSHCNSTAAMLACMPRILFIHGIEDDTVPFTNTAEAAVKVRACGVTNLKEFYIPSIGHVEVIMELMMGGQTSDLVMDWLLEKNGSGHGSSIGTVSDVGNSTNVSGDKAVVADRAIRSRL